MGFLILAAVAIDFFIIATIAMVVIATYSAVGGGILLYSGIKRKAKPPVSVIFIVFGAIMSVFSLFLTLAPLLALAFFKVYEYVPIGGIHNEMCSLRQNI